MLQAWGVDGHNSHTNVCSSSARLGHFLWSGDDRPSPDYANARTILLLSSHLETGHYFNPHAQRIMEAQSDGATLITIDPRLSNTSAKANLWLPAYSGTEGALLLAIARILLEEDLYDKAFVRNWVNWREYLRVAAPGRCPETFESFIATLKAAVRAVHAGVRRGGNRRGGRARSSKRRTPSAGPATASRRTAGAPRRPATCGAGRSRAACTCSSC